MIKQDSWFGLSCNGTDTDFIGEVRSIMQGQKSCIFTLNDIFASALLPGSMLNHFVRERNYLCADTLLNKYHKNLINELSPEDVEVSVQYINDTLSPIHAKFFIDLALDKHKSFRPFQNVFKDKSPYHYYYARYYLNDIKLPRGDDSLRVIGLPVQVFLEEFYRHKFPVQQFSIATLALIAHFTIVSLLPGVQVRWNFAQLLEGDEWKDTTSAQCKLEKRLKDRTASKVAQNCPVIGDARSSELKRAVYTFNLHREDLIDLLYPHVRKYLLLNAVANCNEGERRIQTGVNSSYVEKEVIAALGNYVLNQSASEEDQRTLSVLMHSPDSERFDYFDCSMRAFLVSENILANNGKLDVILHIICGSDAIKLLMCPVVAYWRFWGVRYAFLLSVGGHTDPLRQKMYSRLGFKALFAEEVDLTNFSKKQEVFGQLAEIEEVMKVARNEGAEEGTLSAWALQRLDAHFEADESNSLEQDWAMDHINSLFKQQNTSRMYTQISPPEQQSTETTKPSLTMEYVNRSRALLKVLKEVNSHDQVRDLLPMVCDMTLQYPTVKCLMIYMTQKDINCDGRGGENNELHSSQRRGSAADKVYKDLVEPAENVAKRVFEESENDINTVASSPPRRRRLI